MRKLTREAIPRRIGTPNALAHVSLTSATSTEPTDPDALPWDDAADVVITGEAFSEAAGRRGGLVSCRARVEIKISDKAQKDKLQVDRQTSVAVDLAENVAGKSALQSAGSQLSDRLVASLAK